MNFINNFIITRDKVFEKKSLHFLVDGCEIYHCTRMDMLDQDETIHASLMMLRNDDPSFFYRTAYSYRTFLIGQYGAVYGGMNFRYHPLDERFAENCAVAQLMTLRDYAYKLDDQEIYELAVRFIDMHRPRTEA